MKVKTAAIVLVVFLSLFIAYRFGFLGKSFEPFAAITKLETPIPTQIPIPKTLVPTIAGVSTQSATVHILEAPTIATVSQELHISWAIDTIASTSTMHTAVHYGEVSHPIVRLPGDYPNKSKIVSGDVPASFSAQLIIPRVGLYYYRILAIVNGEYLWSDERSFQVFTQISLPSTPDEGF